MKWVEVTIVTTAEAMEAVSEIFHRAGAAGVVIEDSAELTRTHEQNYGELYALEERDYPLEGVRVKGYFPWQEKKQDWFMALRDEVLGLAEYGLDPGKGEILLKERDEEEWANAWKEYYHPLRISQKITVCPTWEAYEAADGETVIRLDPGMAFGTGTHATTSLSLRLLEKYLQAGEEVADVGCGSGILSIAAAKLGAKRVLALDLDPVALQVARDNVRCNGVEDKIDIRKNDLLEGIAEQTYDLIVANLLADIILRCIPDAAKVLRNNGRFIVSGIIREKAETVKKNLQAQGFHILDEWCEEDWVAMAARKR